MTNVNGRVAGVSCFFAVLRVCIAVFAHPRACACVYAIFTPIYPHYRCKTCVCFVCVCAQCIYIGAMPYLYTSGVRVCVECGVNG